VLSVIVTIVDGGETLERCLEALDQQDNPPRLEIIVPYDESVPHVSDLAQRFPTIVFLPMGLVPTDRPTPSAAGQHELFDRRRATGLAAATGELIAILEDRGVPRADWARQAVALHSRLPQAAIGGAIENGHDRLLNWAVYFCDFGRYQLPFEEGTRDYVSDVNICYKRRALTSTRELWATRYHETTVHWALQRAGEALYLHPAMVVDQTRGSLRLGGLLHERLGWGRLFAYTRAREMPWARRLMFGILAPFLPGILLIRIVRLQFAKRRALSRLAIAWPIVLALLIAWSLGEGAGYVTGKP
jgi:GT2 family glycosyltransferase